jgi:hypothetical protein
MPQSKKSREPLRGYMEVSGEGSHSVRHVAAIEAEPVERERHELCSKLSEAYTRIGVLEGERDAASWPGVIDGWRKCAEAAERQRDEAALAAYDFEGIAWRERAEKAEAERDEFKQELAKALTETIDSNLSAKEQLALALGLVPSNETPDQLWSSLLARVREQTAELERLKEGIREAAELLSPVKLDVLEGSLLAEKIEAWLAAYCPIPEEETK